MYLSMYADIGVGMYGMYPHLSKNTGDIKMEKGTKIDLKFQIKKFAWMIFY